MAKVDEQLLGVSRQTLEEARENWRILHFEIPDLITKLELKLINKKQFMNHLKAIVGKDEE